MEIVEKLERLEMLIMQMVEQMGKLLLGAGSQEWFTVGEFAKLVNRRPYTVRQWANEGRIHARKSRTRTGGAFEWVISREELDRLRREGLLPPDPTRNTDQPGASGKVPRRNPDPLGGAA